MILRRGTILFLVLAVAAAAVKVALSGPLLVVDVLLVASITGFVICAIGVLGRRLAELTHADHDDRHHSSPPPLL